MKIRYSYMAMMLFALLGGTSCTEDFPAQDKTEGQAEGLALQLQVEGSPLASRASLASESALNEDKVNAVDVFFVSNGGTNIEKHFHATTPDTQGRFLLADGDWRSQFTHAPYTVYVLANKHDYDNPETPDNTETDLSWITTIDQLQNLTDTDGEIYEIEGDNNYAGKQFFMDGKTNWTPSDTDEADETINVTLKRAAAKIVVNISYAEDFMTSNQIEVLYDLEKAIVNYAPHAMALNEAAYQEMEVRGEASMDAETYSDAHSTSGEGVSRTDIVYAYSYPNQWGESVERETYVLLNIPYGKESQEGQTPKYHDNYYKVPIRFSNNADELRLDRNKLYTVNVTIDRLGNENIDEPIELKPTFNVADWIPKEIPVNDDAPSYLVLSHEYIEMHNVADTVITFFSSAYLEKVEIVEAYFINKEGERQYVQATQWHTDRQGDIVIDASRDVTSYCEITDWTENALQGNIIFHGEIPTNVTARYVTLRVTSRDPDLNPNYRDVTIVQYPLEYISGVPGVYSTRTDFERTGNTYENYKNHNSVNSNVKLDTEDGSWFDSPTFRSKVSVNGRTYYVSRNGNNGQLRYTNDDHVSSLDNNRMYLVQITSTDESYTVARPKMDGENEDIVTHSSDENNRLVSPAFMLASQLGAVQPSDWSTAQTQCQQYIEYAEADDGTEWRFADWRLPTYEELRIIGKYQNEQPEVMDEVLGGDYYWSAHDNRAWRKSRPDAENPTNNPNGSVYIRCIRDVSPEDLAEFRAHNIR